MKQKKNPDSVHAYLIELYRWHSVLAMAACGTSFISALAALMVALSVYLVELDLTLWFSVSYYTLQSNLYMAVVACMVFPFALEGVRKKRFTYPVWMARLHYSAVVTIAVTMCFTVIFSGSFDAGSAFGRHNLFLHVLNPILILVSFFPVEDGRRLRMKDALIACIPFCLYAVTYTVLVVFVGQERGGWADVYHMTSVPVYVSLPGMLILGLLVSVLIMLAGNALRGRLRKRMQRQWGEDMEEVAVRVEAFGLGRYTGAHGDPGQVEIPMDIFDELSEKYGIRREHLIAPFIKGVLDSRRDSGEGSR